MSIKFRKNNSPDSAWAVNVRIAKENKVRYHVESDSGNGETQ